MLAIWKRRWSSNVIGLMGLALVLAWLPSGLSAQQESAAPTDQKLERVSKAGVEYLLAKGQAEDGSFSKQISPAVTALCLHALIEQGVSVDDPRIKRGLDYLLTMVRDDGGIYAPDSALKNYETSIAVLCLTSANADQRYDLTIERAVGFLKGLQWDDGEGYTADSDFYGGQGYGSHKRPDASNTSFFMDALMAASEDPDSEAIQKAAKFMARCQNLPGRNNTEAFAQKATADDRGGFIYTPVGGGESKAGDSDTGGLRSYASMTYAGLKSFIYAGVSKDDVRVQAAKDWIGRHYDLTTNPGMGEQGLYYYYHVFAKTLDALGEPTITDAQGTQHNWRRDLVSQLEELQKDDGSWTNPADRWYEGDPNLVTAYALLALNYCRNPG